MDNVMKMLYFDLLAALADESIKRSHTVGICKLLMKDEMISEKSQEFLKKYAVNKELIDRFGAVGPSRPVYPAWRHIK
jgi:hypothetical protein